MRLLLVLVLFGLSNAACASDSDGNTLLRSCNAAVQRMDQPGTPIEGESGEFCLGLMYGVVNTNRGYMTLLENSSMFCTPPNGIPAGQAARVVVKYLKEHPKDLNQDMIFLVFNALREAYPCKH